MTYWIAQTAGSWATGSNWSAGSTPSNGDTCVFNGQGLGDVNAGLSTSLTTTTLIVEKTYTGKIGTWSVATQTYLVLDGGTAYISQQTGQGSPSGSPQIMINYGSTAAVVNVYDSSTTSSTTYFAPIVVKGTSLTLNQYGGSVAVAPLQGETATLTAAKIAAVTGTGAPSVAPSLYLGAGVTTTLLTANAGTIYNRSGQTQTTVTLGDTANGGPTYIYDGTGAHTTVSVAAGANCIYSGTGTITTLNNSGTFDRTRDTRALTITNTNLYLGCSILLDNGVASSTTRTNPVAFVQCGAGDITVSTPEGERL